MDNLNNYEIDIKEILNDDKELKHFIKKQGKYDDVIYQTENKKVFDEIIEIANKLHLNVDYYNDGWYLIEFSKNDLIVLDIYYYWNNKYAKRLYWLMYQCYNYSNKIKMDKQLSDLIE